MPNKKKIKQILPNFDVSNKIVFANFLKKRLMTKENKSFFAQILKSVKQDKKMFAQVRTRLFFASVKNLHM